MFVCVSGLSASPHTCMFVCFTELPVVAKEWRGGGGGGEIYLSEQRRTGDEEGGREEERRGGAMCREGSSRGGDEKKKTGKRQMQKREIYCRARMEHIKKRLKGLEREEEVSDAE